MERLERKPERALVLRGCRKQLRDQRSVQKPSPWRNLMMIEAEKNLVTFTKVTESVQGYIHCITTLQFYSVVLFQILCWKKGSRILPSTKTNQVKNYLPFHEMEDYAKISKSTARSIFSCEWISSKENSEISQLTSCTLGPATCKSIKDCVCLCGDLICQWSLDRTSNSK